MTRHATGSPQAVFEDQRTIYKTFGGSVNAAERDGRCFLITSESTMVDLLPEEDRTRLQSYAVAIYEFDDEDHRQRYCQQRGWTQTHG